MSAQQPQTTAARRRRFPRPIAVVLVAVLAYRVLIAVGTLPDTGLNAGDGLGYSVRAALERRLDPGEEVVWFYSEDHFDADDDGSLLTDKRLLGWATGWLDYTIYRTDLNDITAIRVRLGSGVWGKTEILAWTASPVAGNTSLAWGTYVKIPSRGSRDVAFVRDLVLRARDCGANIAVVEVDGATDAELAQIPGATRGTVGDMREPPALPQR